MELKNNYTQHLTLEVALKTDFQPLLNEVALAWK